MSKQKMRQEKSQPREVSEPRWRRHKWLIIVACLAGIQLPITALWTLSKMKGRGTSTKNTIISGHIYRWKGSGNYAPVTSGMRMALVGLSGEGLVGADQSTRELVSDKDGTYRMEIAPGAPVSILFLTKEDLIPDLQHLAAKAGVEQKIDIGLRSPEQARELVKATKALGPQFAAQLEEVMEALRKLPSDDLAQVNISRVSRLREWIGEVIAPTDRKAAEDVLARGGVIQVDGKDGPLSTVAELPPKPFRVILVSFAGKANVGDEALPAIRGCSALKNLNLGQTKVSDAGLSANCKGFQSLDNLDLFKTNVGDVGLAPFGTCRELKWLQLGETRVTDKGVALFKVTNLETLTLNNTPIKDLAFENFKGLPNLQEIGLIGTEIKLERRGIKDFLASCPNLRKVYLRQTKLDEKGLVCFKDCKNLEILDLTDTPVTDSILSYVKGWPNLKEIVLTRTRVTPGGIMALEAALPKDCKITIIRPVP